MAILIKRTFSIWEFFGSSLVLLWFLLGLWHGIYREDKTERNLKKSTFAYTHILGGRAYPVRHYPVAIRLRDRKGRAILCIALNPQSGDFSGAILEVPFKALLHLIKVLFLKKDIDRIVISYRCPIDVLWWSRNTRGTLPHLVGVGVGAFRIVDGIVQATGFFALQSLASN